MDNIISNIHLRKIINDYSNMKLIYEEELINKTIGIKNKLEYLYNKQYKIFWFEYKHLMYDWYINLKPRIVV
jgi:hypothetical protein